MSIASNEKKGSKRHINPLERDGIPYSIELNRRQIRMEHTRSGTCKKRASLPSDLVGTLMPIHAENLQSNQIVDLYIPGTNAFRGFKHVFGQQLDAP